VSDGIESAADRLVPLEPGHERRRVLAFAPPQVGEDAPRLLGGELVPGPSLHVVEAEPVQQRLGQPAQAFVGNDASCAEALVSRAAERAQPVQRDGGLPAAGFAQDQHRLAGRQLHHGPLGRVQLDVDG